MCIYIFSGFLSDPCIDPYANNPRSPEPCRPSAAEVAMAGAVAPARQSFGAVWEVGAAVGHSAGAPDIDPKQTCQEKLGMTQTCNQDAPGYIYIYTHT